LITVLPEEPAEIMVLRADLASLRGTGSGGELRGLVDLSGANPGLSLVMKVEPGWVPRRPG